MTASRIKAPSKQQLLRLIDDLEQRPADRSRIFAEMGITTMAAGAGAGAASAAALASGVTILGYTFAAATPIGWMIAGAAGSALAAYGLARLLRSGALAEGRKAELLLQYKEQAAAMLTKERAAAISDADRSAFVVSLRELIDRDVLTPLHAFRVIEQVEKGSMQLSEACILVQSLLDAPTMPDHPERQHTTARPGSFENCAGGKASCNHQSLPIHEVIAEKTENVSMGLGVASGVVAAGAWAAAPTGISAVTVALGISSAPLIVTAAPVVAAIATAAGVASGETYFYSKWRRGKGVKQVPVEEPPPTHRE